jgi:ABC-type glutathione transport system ATPase component
MKKMTIFVLVLVLCLGTLAGCRSRQNDMTTDTTAATTFCDTLKRLNAELGIAILLISHDPQVTAAAETVHLLKDGTICGSFASEHSASTVATRYLEFMA